MIFGSDTHKLKVEKSVAIKQVLSHLDVNIII